MDCHRCEHLRYNGCRYGRCTHPGHRGVVLSKPKDRSERTYNKLICPDFVMRKRCSNCRYWARGEYFADGKTPAKKGHCSLKLLRDPSECPMWKAGRTSWKKKGKNNESRRQ